MILDFSFIEFVSFFIDKQIIMYMNVLFPMCQMKYNSIFIRALME